MNRLLVNLAFLCFLLPLPAIAERPPSVEKQELMAEASVFMPWKGDLDGMIERRVAMIAGLRIGEETVMYISNIYKYYVAYTLLEEQRDQQQNRRTQVSQQVLPTT